LYDRATGKLTPDSEPNVAALVWVKRYAEKYGREKLLRFRQGFGTYDSPYNAFIDGRVAMEIQGVWFPNFIRRHRPHLEFGVAPFPTPQGVPGPRSLMEADTLALPRSCRHPKEAWKFLEFTQKTGLATMCRLQGKHMPIAHPPANFHEGHPNLELKVFEDLARSPYSFINPRLIVWQEYRDQLSRVFEHVWNWPVPESGLVGLTGAERQRKVDQICEQEIRQSLAEVRERMQGKLDKQRELSQRRGESR
jgi:multiple sugar transport system substrate-binding protein